MEETITDGISLERKRARRSLPSLIMEALVCHKAPPDVDTVGRGSGLPSDVPRQRTRTRTITDVTKNENVTVARSISPVRSRSVLPSVKGHHELRMSHHSSGARYTHVMSGDDNSQSHGPRKLAWPDPAGDQPEKDGAEGRQSRMHAAKRRRDEVEARRQQAAEQEEKRRQEMRAAQLRQQQAWKEAERRRLEELQADRDRRKREQEESRLKREQERQQREEQERETARAREEQRRNEREKLARRKMEEIEGLIAQIQLAREKEREHRAQRNKELAKRQTEREARLRDKVTQRAARCEAEMRRREDRQQLLELKREEERASKRAAERTWSTSPTAPDMRRSENDAHVNEDHQVSRNDVRKGAARACFALCMYICMYVCRHYTRPFNDARSCGYRRG